MANDISKLPKWAQDKIRVLENNVAHWRKLAHSATVEGDSNVLIDDDDGIDQYIA